MLERRVNASKSRKHADTAGLRAPTLSHRRAVEHTNRSGPVRRAVSDILEALGREKNGGHWFAHKHVLLFQLYV